MQILFSLSQSIAQAASALPEPTMAPRDWSQFNDSVLINVTRPNGDHVGNTVCTGVIVNPYAILTTAHCAERATSMTIVYDVENGFSAKKKEIVLAKQILSHPDYHPKKSLYESDLAILFLKDAAPLDSKWIRKIPTSVHPVKSGDRLDRVGVGSRNGQNLRNITNPIFVGIKKKGVFEASDIFSSFGDSGGPIYNERRELLALHSTVDDFDDHAKVPHVYSVYLPDYLAWINDQIKNWELKRK